MRAIALSFSLLFLCLFVCVCVCVVPHFTPVAAYRMLGEVQVLHMCNMRNLFPPPSKPIVNFDLCLFVRLNCTVANNQSHSVITRSDDLGF
jgi:hypothetical protein